MAKRRRSDAHFGECVFGLAAECEELGVGAGVQQGEKHGPSSTAFGRRRRSVGVQVPSLIRVPWVGVPEDGLIGDAELVEAIPDNRGRGLAPGPGADREARCLQITSWNGSF